MKKGGLWGTLCLILGLFVSSVTFGANFPTKPINLLIGYAAGGSTDLRDAFRAAQAATRAAHPDPADWAAFYFLGDWR